MTEFNHCSILTGAAPISVETILYLESLDICLTELYGSSECTGPQTTNMPGN